MREARSEGFEIISVNVPNAPLRRLQGVFWRSDYVRSEMGWAFTWVKEIDQVPSANWKVGGSGPPVGGPIWPVLHWTIGLIAVFAPGRPPLTGGYARSTLWRTASRSR